MATQLWWSIRTLGRMGSFQSCKVFLETQCCCVLLGWHCVEDLSADQSYFVSLGKPTLPHTGSLMINRDLFLRWSASIWDWGSSLRIIAASIPQQSIFFSQKMTKINPIPASWAPSSSTPSTSLSCQHGGVPAPLQVRGGLCQQAELREEGGEQVIWGGGASTWAELFAF